MQFRALGPLEVEGDAGTVQLGGPKERATLALLVLRAGQVVSAECSSPFPAGLVLATKRGGEPAPRWPRHPPPAGRPLRRRAGRCARSFSRTAPVPEQPGGNLVGRPAAHAALATALMAEPRVLLADEASAGLAPAAVDELAGVLNGLRQQGAAVLLVEQNLQLARALADEVVVLDRGAVVYRATAAELNDHRLASLLGLGSRS